MAEDNLQTIHNGFVKIPFYESLCRMEEPVVLTALTVDGK